MKKKFKNYNKHLRNYVLLSLLISLGMLMISALFIISEYTPRSFEFSVPVSTHYFGILVSLFMSIMGLYYYRTLEKK